METVAFKMKLNPGAKEEYKLRHKNIWPELAALLKSKGIHQYNIFYDEETNMLIALQQVDEAAANHDLSGETIIQKWWAYMADIMEVNPDKSPVMVYLEKVFELE